MKIIEIKTVDHIKKQKYHELGRIVSAGESQVSSDVYTYDIILEKKRDNKNLIKFRFNDFKMVKYFISKLSGAHFRANIMRIKDIFGVSIILIFFLFITTSIAISDPQPHDFSECIDSQIIAEQGINEDCNILSIPAREVEDPYVFAISYFNSKMNVIVDENLVSQYEYFDVPFYIYESFMNARSKEEYWKRCINGTYDYRLVY